MRGHCRHAAASALGLRGSLAAGLEQLEKLINFYWLCHQKCHRKNKKAISEEEMAFLANGSGLDGTAILVFLQLALCLKMP